MKRLIPVIAAIALLAGFSLAQGGIVKKRSRPHEYGRVIIDNFSTTQGVPPVAFDHWQHRNKVTCKVCHLDLGFEMVANATGITAFDNARGLFCGACHNGEFSNGSRSLFAACTGEFSPQDRQRCGRCHLDGDDSERVEAFNRLVWWLPKERFGNGVDWVAAEGTEMITPQGRLEGFSGREVALQIQTDFDLEAKVRNMPSIIFSHEKHTVWNGCEACHPDLFLGEKKGNTTYSMIELFQGKYCGACHDKVAFPQKDCQRCHTDQV